MNTNIKKTFSEGYDLFTESTFLLGSCLKKSTTQALKHPKTAFALITVSSFVLGLFRLVIFPLLCMIGIISFPIMAIVKKIQNKNFGKCLVAWGLCVFSTALILSVLVSIILFAPIPALFITVSAAIFISISLTCIQINHSLYKK